MSATPMYFGRVGNQFEIPHPRNGATITRVVPTTSFTTGTGGVRVNRATNGKRQYTLAWQQLFYEHFAQLEAFHHGHEGPGPFVLHDPAQRNWLTVNQSGATSHYNTTDGFSLAASGSNISSSATAYYRGPRSLMWDFVNDSPAASGELSLDAPSPVWPGIPVVAELALCFALRVKKIDTPGATLTARLLWLDSAGDTISASDSTSPVTLTTDWQLLLTEDDPPEGAFYVVPQVLATSVDAATVIHLDVFQLERGSSANPWRPGTGVMPVSVVSLQDRWPWTAEDYREGVVLVLQETGP